MEVNPLTAEGWYAGMVYGIVWCGMVWCCGSGMEWNGINWGFEVAENPRQLLPQAACGSAVLWAF